MTTRPTADRVKESLFNILASRIDFVDILVLDICAGTGSLGIEALSRGAKFCSFIENNLSVKSVLEKNLRNTNHFERSEIVVSSAVNAIYTVARRGQTYDLAFFDPPYDSSLYQCVSEALDDTHLLASGSILVAECSAKKSLPETYGRLRRFDRRVYGDTAIELFTPEDR
jgi:16S rRNA (guanine(966)-N(2))-methyltransferase RsmD